MSEHCDHTQRQREFATVDKLGCPACAVAELARLRADQAHWRKGVGLIASALGERNPADLCCSRIADLVLCLRARDEALTDLFNEIKAQWGDEYLWSKWHLSKRFEEAGKEKP